ncbi:alpha/beta fold hydrolase [Geodermatophilus dictyosporus]|uniref:alpha/beta fold hydrolase n=1 Tax=Geodermatophilus dictyosporus TaxID=1523247 RepID=UPI000A6C7DC1
MTRVPRAGLICMTHETVTSADGTSIAYEVSGAGPLQITVCGATCDRALMRPTDQALGRYSTTVDHDRRGRGDSGDTLPYAIDREVEDIAALIDRLGGPAHLYGHSSGAGLVLHAVAAGLPVDGFVLHDPPYSPDDRPSRDAARRGAGGRRGPGHPARRRPGRRREPPVRARGGPAAGAAPTRGTPGRGRGARPRRAAGRARTGGRRPPAPLSGDPRVRTTAASSGRRG